ncbi:MAG: RNA polymerase sigma factor [Defluviitaleaceae bacterium]|nr:RNA polymerase sigma factor [Defluviitaleaceae bacterium]MCL2262962.1 RNA polymerase sigma factor [Defluviitaleaceae bacterium]
MFLSLLSALSEDERQAFNDIYYRLEKRCLAMARKITKNPTDAEDALHDTFVKILEHRKLILSLPCHRQDAYIVTMVRNKAIDIYRKKKHMESLCYDTGEEQFESVTFDDGEKIYESMEGFNKLNEIINTLPPIYRIVAVMRFLDGFTNEEISQLLGIKKATVAKQIERARKILMQGIKEGGYHGK